MIEKTIDNWHRFLRGELPGGLDELLDDDVIFYSPVVFTPQKGKAVTKLYLRAAAAALPGETSRGTGEGSFRYVNEVMSGRTAVLEFETTVGGKYVNGVDIIRCDEVGRIVEFKVMIRPLQAVNAVHASMKAMLETLSKAAPSAAGP